MIGLGEVGRRLATAIDAAGTQPRPVTRSAGREAALDPADPAARIVAVREENPAEAWQRFAPALARGGHDRRAGWVHGGTRAPDFRNGAFAQFVRKHGVPTPVTSRPLRAVGFAAEVRE